MEKYMKLTTLILVFTIFFSCKDDQEIDWDREEFNSDYTIMFPKTYEGGISEMQMGRLFNKRRNDDKVIVTGGFCITDAYPSCSASDYLEQPLESIPDSVILHEHVCTISIFE